MSGRVGPVLHACRLSEAVIAALRDANPDIEVVDRGAYLRVLASGRCAVTREAIERRAGARFSLPGDLETIMPSFRGHLVVTEDEVCWESP